MTSSESTDSYVCEICSKAFSERIELRNHFAQHKIKSTKAKGSKKRIILSPEIQAISNTRNNYMDSYQKTLELARELSKQNTNSNDRKINTLNNIVKKVTELPTAVIAPMNFTGTSTKYTIPKKKSSFLENRSNSRGTPTKIQPRLSKTRRPSSKNGRFNLIENSKNTGKIPRNSNVIRRKSSNSTATHPGPNNLNGININNLIEIHPTIEIPCDSSVIQANSPIRSHSSIIQSHSPPIQGPSSIQSNSPSRPHSSAIQSHSPPIRRHSSSIQANSPIRPNSSLIQVHSPPFQRISESSLRLDPRLDPSLKRKQISILNPVECDQKEEQSARNKKSKISCDKMDLETNNGKPQDQSIPDSKKLEDRVGHEMVLKPQIVYEDKCIIESKLITPLQEFQAIDNIINNANTIDTLIVDFPDNEVNFPDYEVNITQDSGGNLTTLTETKKIACSMINNLVCPICQRCFKNQSNLNYHKRIHDQNSKTSTVNGDNQVSQIQLDQIPQVSQSKLITTVKKVSDQNLIPDLTNKSKTRRSSVKEKQSDTNNTDQECTTNLTVSNDQNINAHEFNLNSDHESVVEDYDISCHDDQSSLPLEKDYDISLAEPRKYYNTSDQSPQLDVSPDSNQSLEKDYDLSCHGDATSLEQEKNYDTSCQDDQSRQLEDYDISYQGDPQLSPVIFKCDFCSKSFPKRIQLNKHKLKSHENDQNLNMNKVSKESKWEMELSKTNYNEISETNINIDHAEKVEDILSKRDSNTDHSNNVKDIPREYDSNIDHANKVKDIPREHDSNIDQSSKTRLFKVRDHKCEICSRMFTKGGLSIHSFTHKNRGSYKCTVCSKLFASNFSLKRHSQKSHPNNIGEITFQLKCSKCSETFNEQEKFIKHNEKECSNKQSESIKTDHSKISADHVENIHECDSITDHPENDEDIPRDREPITVHPEKNEDIPRERDHNSDFFQNITNEYELNTDYTENMEGNSNEPDSNTNHTKNVINLGTYNEKSESQPKLLEERLNNNSTITNGDKSMEILMTNVQNRTRKANERRSTEKRTKLDEYNRALRDQECQICSKMFTKSGIFNHSFVHQNTANFQCSFCSRAFKRQANLNRHCKVFHPNGIVENSREPECFKCSKCSETFDHPRKLIEHNHSACSTTAVNITNEEFLASVLLKRRRLEKKRLKPHKCSRCGKRFKSNENFKNHERMHKRLLNRYYKCRYCGKFYGQLAELREHKLEHRNEVVVPGNLVIKREPDDKFNSTFEVPTIKREPRNDQNDGEDLRSRYLKQYSNCLEAVMPRLDGKNEDLYAEAYWILPFNFNLLAERPIKIPFSNYGHPHLPIDLKKVFISVLRVSANTNGPIECKVPASYLKQFSKTLAVKLVDIKYWI